MPEPKKSILRRVFGDPVDDATEESLPGIRAAWSGRQIERPDIEGSVSSIRPMSIFNKWRYPDAYASTNMFGGIQLNKALIDKDKQDINDVLIHEMTHANQGVGGFLRKMYSGGSKDENEAINAESMRKVRRDDIPLRSNETSFTGPINQTKIFKSGGASGSWSPSSEYSIDNLKRLKNRSLE